MGAPKRIFVSMAADEWLEPSDRQLKKAFVSRIRDRGFEPEFFLRELGPGGLTSGGNWNPENLLRVMRRCVGAAALALPRWTHVGTKGKQIRIATEYNHYEAAVAHALGLPLLVVADTSIEQRGIYDHHCFLVAEVPPGSGEAGLEVPAFTLQLDNWIERVEERPDVFLGYSSRSAGIADEVRDLVESAGATVDDWAGFSAGGTSILEHLETSARRCSGGIFILTMDDKLADDADPAAPRDNVVFEAGFFAAAKGRERVLIFRQEGAKLPDDLGSVIYLPFTDAADISEHADKVRAFVETGL